MSCPTFICPSFPIKLNILEKMINSSILTISPLSKLKKLQISIIYFVLLKKKYTKIPCPTNLFVLRHKIFMYTEKMTNCPNLFRVPPPWPQWERISHYENQYQQQTGSTAQSPSSSIALVIKRHSTPFRSM